MNTVTHALLPVVVICAYQRLQPKSTPLTNWHLGLIGLFGAAPDLLNPHLSLQSRYESWSHSLVAWLAFTVILLIFSYVSSKKMRRLTAVLMALAYLVHLICDALSGGIAWLRPFSDSVIGAYYVSPSLWIPLDVFFVFAAYLFLRTASGVTKRGLREKS